MKVVPLWSIIFILGLADGKRNRRDDILHGGGSFDMEWVKNNENDKARGEKQWLT